jgi:hypothetical protein
VPLTELKWQQGWRIAKRKFWQSLSIETETILPMVTTRSLPSRSAKPRMIASFVVALVLGLDQLSKQWALTALGQVRTTLVLPGPVDLTLVFNYSNAFGLMMMRRCAVCGSRPEPFHAPKRPTMRQQLAVRRR